MGNTVVKVCLGTTCFVMGGNYINELTEAVEKKFGCSVDIVPSACLSQCTNSHSKAPFVEINGDIIQQATVEKVLAEIEKRMNQNGQ